MAGMGTLLFETSAGWQLLAIGDERLPRQDIDASVDPDQLSAHIEAFSREHGLPRDVVIAPNSFSAYFATLPSATRKTRTVMRDQTALAFQLEESLPFDAEESVADFQIGSTDVSGIAIEKRVWLPIVVAFEARGMLVQSIIPAAVLALSSLESSHKLGRLLLWQHEELCDLFQRDGSSLVDWRNFSAQPTVVTREVVMSTTGKERVTVINGSASVLDAVRAATVEDVREVTTDDMAVHAVRGAVDVLRGRREPPFELRRGALMNGDRLRTYKGALHWLWTAAALFVLMLLGSWWWRAHVASVQLVETRAELRSLFTEAFPDSRVPKAIVSRIESEHTKVVGSRETGPAVTSPTPALEVLQGFLAGLPSGVRSRVMTLRIENGRLDADVELQSHADAGVIAKSLAAAGFEIDPPTTQQADEKTVVSRLRGEWKGQHSDARRTVPLAQRGPQS